LAKRLRLKIRDENGDARLDAAVVERLLAELEADREATLVTLESDGAAFCEGLDLGAVLAQAGAAAAMLGSFAALLDALETTPRPVVALVNGRALGGGMGLLAAADVVIAAPHATFGLPETLFGLIPAIVLPVVARRTGPARARWLAVSTLSIPASEALRVGLVDEVSADLEAALAGYARRFDRIDLRALAEVKAIAVALRPAHGAYHEDVVHRFEHLASSAATRERVTRFLAGETPWPDSGTP
jgi:polyketide biosynthesis enoyl-CoA hydratase PksH